MLNFFDKLKTLFQSRDIKISPTFKFSLYTRVDNSKKITSVVINDKKELSSINLAALTKDQDGELANLFKEAGSGTAFLSENTSKLLEATKQTLSEGDSKALIKFFEGKIPQDDFRILKAAIVLRKKFKEGENIADYKRKLSEIYGAKANTISNMCTAGYFEDFLMPLYKTMSNDENFRQEFFTEAYKQLIQDFPIAIFINSSMSLEELEQKIRSRIGSNKKYRIPYLNIHGIGRSNLSAISTIVAKLNNPDDYTQKTIDEKDGIIIVKLK